MVFLSEAQVAVTGEELIVGNQRYSLAGVTSVRQGVQSPSRRGPLETLIVGIAVCGSALVFQSAIAAFVGMLLLAIGLFWSRIGRPRHVVILSSPPRERRAFANGDQDFTRRVVQAVEEALARKK